jgi:diaminohydroxyphosphoribosylaminopyrimidine deaminase/5-amino-6-(5-phosphoribosylamino)uracil reductase
LACLACLASASMDFPRPTSRTLAVSPSELATFERVLGELSSAAPAHRFRVAPNPCVGAALYSDGVEIARGFHEEWGGPHAEIQTFRAAAASGVPAARWDTLVITLEPCSAQGKKTPPCVAAILEHGLRRVIVGALDPDPRQRGEGLELLECAGVEVALLRGPAPLERVAPHFVRWTDPDRVRRARPWTIAKWAQTRSGQLVPPRGHPRGRWISGAAALEEVQRLRGRVDAIVTGVGTVLADDPRFSVRAPGDRTRAPLRIVLDSELRTPASARLFAAPGPDEAAGPVHVLTRAGASAARHRALEEAGAVVHLLHAGDDGRPSLREVDEWLWQSGVRRVLLEAGPTLVKAYFEAERIDQIAVVTGDVVGGLGASLAPFLSGERLQQIERREVGSDAWLEAFVARG